MAPLFWTRFVRIELFRMGDDDGRVRCRGVPPAMSSRPRSTRFRSGSPPTRRRAPSRHTLPSRRRSGRPPRPSSGLVQGHLVRGMRKSTKTIHRLADALGAAAPEVDEQGPQIALSSWGACSSTAIRLPGGTRGPRKRRRSPGHRDTGWLAGRLTGQGRHRDRFLESWLPPSTYLGDFTCRRPEGSTLQDPASQRQHGSRW